jgi:HEAT repeat protein
VVDRGADALPALLRLLDDQYPPLRAEAVAALAELGPVAVPVLLEEGLHHRDWWAREAAAETLGRIAAPRTVTALIDALSDQSKGVREAASRALGALGDARAVPYLSALARHDSQPSVRAVAREVLQLLPAPVAAGLPARHRPYGN